MKWITFILVSITCFSQAQVSTDSLRVWYVESVEDEDLTEELIEYMENKATKSALEWGFYASGKALLAKHAFNPYYKLEYLGEAEKLFEKAVQLNPKDPEIRFMRLAVEHYVPAFLGYSEHIEEDLKVLYDYLLKGNQDSEIYTVIKDFIFEIERLSPEQESTILARK